MKRRMKFLIAILFCGGLIAAGYSFFRSDDNRLAAVHLGIKREFPGVRHIDGDGLSALDPDRIVLFDIREPSEFAVSHLKNAIRVDPDISAAQFIEKFSPISKGKSVIFYCSVGQRSSGLADRVQRALLSAGAKAAYNLEGGIFRWHNEDRPLYRAAERSTRFVHPYSPVWGRMVRDQKNTRY